MEYEYWGQFVDLEEQYLGVEEQKLEYKKYIEDEKWIHQLDKEDGECDGGVQMSNKDDAKLDKSMLCIIMSMSILSCMLILF